jgi:hypothetical protein
VITHIDVECREALSEIEISPSVGDAYSEVLASEALAALASLAPVEQRFAQSGIRITHKLDFRSAS